MSNPCRLDETTQNKVAYAMGYEQGKADAFNLKENADGCEGCAFMQKEEWEMPCTKCKRNMKDYWRSKVTE